MDTPIRDFLRQYLAGDFSRLHLPGHKGRGPLGCERLDITEISGADSLYQAAGVIAASEAHAAALFGSGASFYSAGGASQCIRAMLYLAVKAKTAPGRPLVLASRNAHISLIIAAALLDFDLAWLWPKRERFDLCSCPVSPEDLAKALSGLDSPPAAVYVTSPDYLGNRLDIAGLARISHGYGVPLLVDNAHGAYLHFLEQASHPLDLGADLSADSAHKTLPVLTGGAYLHIGKQAPPLFAEEARQALALFGSTSPSYLILQSLDQANPYLAAEFRRQLKACVSQVRTLKSSLLQLGWPLAGTEPLKLTILPRARGYSGTDLAQKLREARVEGEYADRDHLTLMFSPHNQARDFQRIYQSLSALPGLPPLPRPQLSLPRPQMYCSPRQALFSPAETVAAADCSGRALASPSVSCPPAVPIVVSGEIISPEAVKIFQYYGLETLSVIKEG